MDTVYVAKKTPIDSDSRPPSRPPSQCSDASNAKSFALTSPLVLFQRQLIPTVNIPNVRVPSWSQEFMFRTSGMQGLRSEDTQNCCVTLPNIWRLITADRRVPYNKVHSGTTPKAKSERVSQPNPNQINERKIKMKDVHISIPRVLLLPAHLPIFPSPRKRTEYTRTTIARKHLQLKTVSYRGKRKQEPASHNSQKQEPFRKQKQ